MEYVVSRDDTRIAYQVSGAGRPLILVHGTSADHRRWAAVSSAFEQDYTVYAVDRRGRGGSGDAPEYDILREAEDVVAVVEAAYEQDGAPLALVGHSFGGICSLEAALLTDKISKLVLYEPPLPLGRPLYAPDFPERMQAMIDSGEMEQALETFFRDEVKMTEGDLAKFRRLPMWQERIKAVPSILREIVIDRTYRFDPARFSNMHTPTLLLLGSERPPIFREPIEALDAALPNRRVVILQGEQHVAMDTNPELFEGEVLAFLGDLDPKP